MKVITRYAMAQNAIKRWGEQYGREKKGSKWSDITAKLAALNPPIDPDQVDSIIGNRFWTEPPTCSECGERSDPVIEVGQEPDYDSHTAYLCLPCFAKLVDLVKEKTA